MAERTHKSPWRPSNFGLVGTPNASIHRAPQPEGGAAPSAVAHQNLLLSGAMDAVQTGDLEAAQSLLDAADGVPLTLGQVFRLYQTELETQAQQLRESQLSTEQTLDWFANLFRTLPVAALLVDRQGRIVDANAMALDELNLGTALRTLPVPLRRLMASTDGELRLAALLPRVAPGSTEGLDDMALRTLDGQARWADLRITQVPARRDPHDDTGGTAVAPLYLCVLNDRTARVEAQRAREAAAHAEHQRDLAQSASQAKTQLLSRVSHELRTPLNAVIGFSHLMLMNPDKLDTAHRRQVQHISDAGQHLLALVDEVLDINRTEAGMLALDLQAVSLIDITRQVLALQQPMAAPMRLSMGLEDDDLLQLARPLGAPANANATAIADTERPEPLALGDPRRVREVLTNLVSNAIKYNRPGGWVHLRLGHDAARVWLEVCDSGIGMSDQQMAHLFEPFNRLGAEQLKVSGHGLGLSIARTLTHAMGGELHASSVPGQGSCFVLALPRWMAERPLPPIALVV